MGFLGKVFKGIGKVVGSVVKGVAKFASSPIGKALFGVGLGILTGGASTLLTGGLSSIMSGLGSGGLSSMFSGLASNFLGSASSLLSGSGSSILSNVLGAVTGGGGGSGGIANIIGSLVQNWSSPSNAAQQPDATAQQAARENAARIAAYYQSMTYATPSNAQMYA